MPDATSKFIVETSANLTGLQKATKAMQDAEQVSRSLSRTLSQDAKFIEASTRTSFTKAGSAINTTTAFFEDGGRRVAVTSKQIGNNAKLVGENITGIGKASGSAIPFVDDFQRALARVLIVVPIWFAFRRAAQFVFTTLRDGVKDIISFERALERIRRNIQGTADTVDRDISRIRNTITDLSIRTGRSVEEVAEAVKQFTTIGFEVDDSLALAEASLKAAILLFEDGGKTAEAFARSFKILADTSKGAKPLQDQFNEAIALTVKLGENNADVLSELNQALLKSAGTARAAGLSFNELIILLETLATAGRTGSQAGTLLSASLTELLGNLDKLAPVLGITVKEGDRAFDTLLKILDASEQMINSKFIRDRAQVVEAFEAIFGGQRGTKIITALASVNQLLRENARVVGSVDELNQEFDRLTETTPILADRFRNLNREIGKAFVTGIVGGENFNDALKKLNTTLEGVLKNAEATGRGISIALNAFILRFPTVKKQIEDLDKVSLNRLQDRVRDVFKIEEIADPSVIEDLLRNFQEAVPGGLFGFTEEFRHEAIRQLEERLIELQRIANDQKIKLQTEIETPTEIVQVSPLPLKTLQSISKAILDNELALLKIRGATNSQLLKAQNFRSQQLGIIEDELDVLKRELELERSITEEQRLRNELSSETVRLFRISQEEGVGIAKAIGEVLSGQRDFNSFVRRGGRELEVFKQQFAEIFEQQQALRFFRGETVPGAEGVRGGAGIPIAEEALRTPIRRFQPTAGIEARRAAERFREITTNIQQRIEVSVKVFGLDKSRIKDAVKSETIKAVADEINRAGSPINTELDTFLEEF